jgi:hypothetical protein
MDTAVIHYYNGVPSREGLHTRQESLDEFFETSRIESALNDVTMDHSIS